jgi:hypothetical protein
MASRGQSATKALAMAKMTADDGKIVRFSTDHQPSSVARKGRGKGTRAMLIEALQGRGLTPESFIESVIDDAIASVNPPRSSMAAKLALLDLLAKRRPAHDVYTVAIPDGASTAEKIAAISSAVIAGDVPADVGGEMVALVRAEATAILDLDAIQAIEEANARIDDLEAENAALRAALSAKNGEKG